MVTAGSGGFADVGFFGVDQSEGAAWMLQVQFPMEIGQAGFDSLGALIARVDEQADRHTTEHAQRPEGGAVAHTAAIFICADIQTLVLAGLQSPIGTLDLRQL